MAGIFPTPPRPQARFGRHASTLTASRRRKRSPVAVHADQRDGDRSPSVDRLTETTDVSRANLVYGQVKILKRDDEVWSPAKRKSDPFVWPSIHDVVMLEWEMDNSEFFATHPFVVEYPEPSSLPLPSFLIDSPEPSSLPLPSFALMASSIFF